MPRAAVALQPALLLSSLIVVTAAAFGGLMLESNSQYSTTRPQVDVSFAMTDDGSAVLATKVRASKLRAQDHLAMSVLGLPGTPDFACMPSAGQDGRQTTTGTPLDPCGQIPCVRRPCVFIAGALLRPDANGVIQHEFTVPIQSRQFLHLSVVAQLCPDQGACPVNQALATTVDFRIPQPSAAGDSTNDAESTLPVEAP